MSSLRSAPILMSTWQRPGGGRTGCSRPFFREFERVDRRPRRWNGGRFSYPWCANARIPARSARSTPVWETMSTKPPVRRSTRCPWRWGFRRRTFGRPDRACWAMPIPKRRRPTAVTSVLQQLSAGRTGSGPSVACPAGSGAGSAPEGRCGEWSRGHCRYARQSRRRRRRGYRRPAAGGGRDGRRRLGRRRAGGSGYRCPGRCRRSGCRDLREARRPQRWLPVRGLCACHGLGCGAVSRDRTDVRRLDDGSRSDGPVCGAAGLPWRWRRNGCRPPTGPCFVTWESNPTRSGW